MTDFQNPFEVETPAGAEGWERLYPYFRNPTKRAIFIFCLGILTTVLRILGTSAPRHSTNAYYSLQHLPQ